MKNKYFFWASFILFSISLVLPVILSRDHFIDYYTTDNPENLGYFYLIMGYLTILELPIDFICWSGNFILLLSWIFYRFPISKYLNVLAVIQMSIYGIDHLFQLKIIEFSDYDFPLFGYWIWFSSSIAMLFYLFYPKEIENIESQIG